MLYVFCFYKITGELKIGMHHVWCWTNESQPHRNLWLALSCDWQNSERGLKWKCKKIGISQIDETALICRVGIIAFRNFKKISAVMLGFPLLWFRLVTTEDGSGILHPTFVCPPSNKRLHFLQSLFTHRKPQFSVLVNDDGFCPQSKRG